MAFKDYLKSLPQTLTNPFGMASSLLKPKAPAPLGFEPLNPQAQAIRSAAQTTVKAPTLNPATTSVKPPLGSVAPRINPVPTPTQTLANPTALNQSTPPPQVAPPAPSVSPQEPPRAAQTLSPTPTAPNPAEEQLKALQKAYLGTFDQTPEEKATQAQLDAISGSQSMLRANEQAGEANVAEQPIAFSLIGGQQAALQRQLNARLGQEAAQAQPLAAKLASYQANREAAQRKSQAEVGFTQSQIEQQRQTEKDKQAASKPIEVGGVLVDPVTFKPVYQPEKAPIELSPGNTVFDPVTGKPLYTAPTTKALSGGGSVSGGGGRAGGGGTGSAGLSSTAQAVINGTLRLSDLTPTVRGQIGAELDKAGYRQDARLSPTQQGEIADAQTINELADRVLSYNADNKLEGVGPVAGSFGSAYDTLTGAGSAEAHDVRQLVGNIRGTIAKLRGGTSFTPNEEAMLNSYTPKVTDNQAIVISKLNGLKQFLASRTGNIQAVAQGQQGQLRQTNQTNTSGVTPSGISYTVSP